MYSDVTRDERFVRLLGLTAERGVLRSEFDGFEMPHGMQPNEAWEALARIRQAQAIHLKDTLLVDGRPVDQWYSRTHSIENKLRELASRTCSGSSLDMALSERYGRRFVVKSLIEEVVAAAACDGLAIDYETTRAITVGERVPSTPTERIVSNLYGLLGAMMEAAYFEITPASIMGLYGQLTRGVETEHLSTGVPWNAGWPEDPLPPERTLQDVCGFASGAQVDPNEHPIIVGQRMICRFWRQTPLPCCNYLMGSLVSRIYLKQKGYPVFVYIPTSSLTLAWRQGGYVGEGVCAYYDAGYMGEGYRDWTMYWESGLYLLLRELDALEAYVFAVKERDDELLVSVREDQSLNYRQHDVVCRALLVPETTFKIRAHQDKYGLAYSTARKDLATLVERGFFDMRYEEKAQVYVARYDLKSVLSKRYGLDAKD